MRRLRSPAKKKTPTEVELNFTRSAASDPPAYLASGRGEREEREELPPAGSNWQPTKQSCQKNKDAVSFLSLFSLSL